MLEIEAKIKVDSLDAVAARLESIGATFVDKLVQLDRHFDSPRCHLRFADKSLRLRHQSSAGIDRIILTYKGPRRDSKFKSRDEYETEVDDSNKLIAILAGLGYEVTVGLEKRRDLWMLDDCQVCLDEVAMLGSFVEVEAASESQIEAVLKKLGLSELEHITTGYAGMIRKKIEEGSVDSRYICFEGEAK